MPPYLGKVFEVYQVCCLIFPFFIRDIQSNIGIRGSSLRLMRLFPTSLVPIAIHFLQIFSSEIQIKISNIGIGGSSFHNATLLPTSLVLPRRLEPVAQGREYQTGKRNSTQVYSFTTKTSHFLKHCKKMHCYDITMMQLWW